MKLTLTIDSEAEGQWKFGAPVQTQNPRFWPPFQELCERHGIVPTYLVASEIVEDEFARGLLTELLKRGTAEVGTHLHPWTTPPYVDRLGLRYNDEIHAYPSQLPPDLLGEKISNLTKQVESAFGVSPKVFRAGRFGFNSSCAAILRARGYDLDSSVTPYVSWGPSAGLDGAGGPDFSRFSPHPFRIAHSGKPELLELPVTIMPTYALLRRFPPLLRAYRGLPGRGVRKLLPRAWLRKQPAPLNPSPENGVRGLTQVWQAATGARLDTTVMMFHSSELMPGGTPYRPTAESVGELLDCIDTFLSFVSRQGGQFTTLLATADRLASDAGLETRPI